jgi:glycosyltransferase involved in cell wall biosynthesis
MAVPYWGYILEKALIMFPRVTVVLPAYNEAATIGRSVRSVLSQCPDGVELEVIVVDDGSQDHTGIEAQKAGAMVLVRDREAGGGNPAAARNLGARAAKGDPIIFLDADCVPADGWLQALLNAHAAGAVIVGGSLGLPPGLSWLARCDYYCGWYVVHPRRPAGKVLHHPPPNLSVRRAAFLSTSGFSEQPPLEYTNEERAWQAELRGAGYSIYFEPGAVVYHHNHPGFLNLLRRNYRWAYTAIESKSQSGTARLPWLYQYPRLLIAASLPLAFVHTVYILGCWIRAGVFEPIGMLPVILASRFAYVAGMSVGGLRWLWRQHSASQCPVPGSQRWTK